MKKYLIVEVTIDEWDDHISITKTPLYVLDADGIVPFEGLPYDIYEILEGGTLNLIQDGER